MLKKKIGTAVEGIDRGSAQVCGRDLRTGLATTIEVTTEKVRRAIHDPLSEIVSMVKMTLETTPPELSSDIITSGITLTGGSASLRGLDKLIERKTGMTVHTADNPTDCVITGIAVCLQKDNLNLFR
jgi:rod shape-determining protein MreB